MPLVSSILFLATLYNLVLVVIIMWKAPRHRAGITFAWYILGSAAWTACTAMAQMNVNYTLTWRMTQATFVCAAIIATSWMWFCADFPSVSRPFRRLSGVMTVLGLPWLYLTWTQYLIPSVKVESWGVNAQVGPWVPYYTIWAVACAFLGIAHLIAKSKTLRGLERLQVRYIFLGAAGIVIVGSIPNLILPAITGTTRYAPWGPLSTLFVTTTATYAIARFRLMDIRIVLRAGLIYSITIGVLSLAFALLVPMIDSALRLRFNIPSGAGSFLMAFLMALAFQPLRRHVQNIVDRRFFKSVYDYRLALREAGSALASARDRELLVDTMVTALGRTLRPRGVAVFVPGNDETLTLVSNVGCDAAVPPTLSIDDPLLTLLRASDEVLLTEECIRQHEPYHSLGQRLHSWGAYVAQPLLAGVHLRGVVLLGEKLSGDVYTADDVALLRILGTQAAIALDNARHYDEMVLLNDYHARLLQILQDGVIALDPQARILTFNAAAAQITGVQADAAVGKRLEEIGLGDLPCEETGGYAIEVTLNAPNGQILPVQVSVTPFLRRREVEHCQLLVFRDLSMLRALEQEKMQAERFSSMGAMAASLAHEIKNPLVPIKTFAHLLPSRYEDTEFREEFSQTVLQEVERITRLINQMLDLVRNPSDDSGCVELPEVIERLIGLLRTECERNDVWITLDTAEGLPPVTGVAGQLYQALLNVLMNAVQAVPTGGTVRVSLTAADGYVRCRIVDSGPGVPAEDLPRLFEPFYTTKPGGHGLGLALTYQFIRSNGGEVSAECPPEGGLAVILTLPAWQPAEAELLCT